MQPNSSPVASNARHDTRDSNASGARATIGSATSLKLERRIDGKLWLLRSEGEVAVEVVRCFPWTEPTRYLSLRDAKGLEQAFVLDAVELDAASRSAVQAALTRASFVLEITHITSVDEDFELRTWQVQTRQGPRSFQTRLDEWPRELDAGGLVIEDVYGDLYRVQDPAALDAKSRRLLWAFVD